MSDQQEYWQEYIDETRTTPGGYVLNGKDRMYCATGRSQGSLKKSKLKSRIKEDRIQELPRRIQDIIDDIALLKYADVDFLSGYEKKSLCRGLLSIEHHAYKRINTRFTYPPDPEAKFGFELGAAVKELKNLDSFDEVELIWGIIIGIYGGPDEEGSKEAEIIEDLISKLQYKQTNRNGWVERELEAEKSYYQAMDDIKNKIKKGFNEKGTEIDYLPSKIEKNIQNFRKDVDVSDLLENLDYEQLKWNMKLKEMVEHDVNKIENENWRGEKAEAIINELWLQHKTDGEDALQFEDMNTASNRNTAMKLINQYSSVDKHKDVAQHPIIEETNIGFRLTAYGQLISYCFFENNKDCEWIEAYDIYKGNRNDDVLKIRDRRRSLLQNFLAEVDIDVDLFPK